jgi:uncharacterized protein DUF6161
VSDTLENTEKPLFRLDLGPDGGALSPRSLAELTDWLQAEQTFWSWLITPPIVNNVPEAQRQLALLQTLQQFLVQAGNADQKGDHANRDRLLNDFQNHLRGSFLGSSPRHLHASSPRAQFLGSLPDKVVAAYAWRHFTGLGLSNPGNYQEMRGFALASAFDLGLTPERSKQEERALNELRQRIEREHELLRAAAGRLNDEFSATNTNVSELHQNQAKQYGEAQAVRSTEFKSLMADIQGRLEKLRTESETNLKNIADTYDKKMSLQSAVTYLQTKANTHKKMALGMGAVSLLAAGVFGYAVLRLSDQILGTSQNPSWPHVAVAVLIATLCFWLLRILVRIFLSNLHLTTDSRNRATLMQTYLALLREGDALKTDDRALILKMLFRPFSDGVVKDDATPPGLWDVITRGTSGR